MLSPRSPRQREEFCVPSFQTSESRILHLLLGVLAILARDIFSLLVVALKLPRRRDTCVRSDAARSRHRHSAGRQAGSGECDHRCGRRRSRAGHADQRRGCAQARRGTGAYWRVTAIIPRGKNSTNPVFAGWATSNAAGEMTGTTWLEERGYFDGPVMITNTHSVGVVRDAVVGWIVDHKWPGSWYTPVVAETYDGYLNDTDGMHVTKEHALEALRRRKTGRGGGGHRRRRHRHGLLRLQGRHRHIVARHHDAGRHVHGRRAGPMQLRFDADAARWRDQGGRGAQGPLLDLHDHAAFAVPEHPYLRIRTRRARSRATAR